MSARILTLPPVLAKLHQQTLAWWSSRVLRERQMLLLVSVVVVLFATWTLFVQPGKCRRPLQATVSPCGANRKAVTRRFGPLNSQQATPLSCS